MMFGKDFSPGDRVEIKNAVGQWSPGEVVDISDVVNQYPNSSILDDYCAVRHDGGTRVFMVSNHSSVLRLMEASGGKDVDQRTS